MRSAILSEQLKEKQEQKRQKHRRRMNRLYNRAYRKRQKLQKRQKEAAVPKHPTLPDAEIAAVEEAMEWERPPAPKQPVVQVVEASPKQPALQTSPVDAEQREQRVAEHMKELQVLKYGPLEPEPKPRIPASLDLPNGIIL